MKTVILLLASGRSSRLGLEVAKQYQKIKGKYLLEYSLLTFNCCEEVDEICLVTSKDWVSRMQELKQKYSKLNTIIAGGAERYDSVYEGVCFLKQKFSKKEEIKVLIHDSARLFVSQEIIENTIKKLDAYRAVSVVAPLSDTLVLGDDSNVKKTLKREDYRLCQTPQGFYLDEINEAYTGYIKKETKQATDDTSIYREYFPKNLIGSVRGEELNFKVTHKNQLVFSKFLIESLTDK